MALRADLVNQCAPIAPPCFPDRLIWLSYLESAAEEQRPDHPEGPLIFEVGKPVRFNYEFSFCGDCGYSALQRAELAQVGICRPNHLLKLAERQQALPPDNSPDGTSGLPAIRGSSPALPRTPESQDA